MLKFIGLGGAFNTQRGNTCAYLERGTELFLIDAGEDVFPKLLKHNLFKDKTNIHIFITHLHSDHIGSLSSTIFYLYFSHFNMDSSKINVYFPNTSLCTLLSLQGTTNDYYSMHISRENNIFLFETQDSISYIFSETKHTDNLDYNGKTNSFQLELFLNSNIGILYSGDTAKPSDKLANIQKYDYVFHEVTSNPHNSAHCYYNDFVKAVSHFSAKEKNKIYFMHLDIEFNEEKVKQEGYHIAEEIL